MNVMRSMRAWMYSDHKVWISWIWAKLAIPARAPNEGTRATSGLKPRSSKNPTKASKPSVSRSLEVLTPAICTSAERCPLRNRPFPKLHALRGRQSKALWQTSQILLYQAGAGLCHALPDPLKGGIRPFCSTKLAGLRSASLARQCHGNGLPSKSVVLAEHIER